MLGVMLKSDLMMGEGPQGLKKKILCGEQRQLVVRYWVGELCV